MVLQVKRQAIVIDCLPFSWQCHRILEIAVDTRLPMGLYPRPAKTAEHRRLAHDTSVRVAVWGFSFTGFGWCVVASAGRILSGIA